MKIKKIIAILLSVSFVCSVLTACSSKKVDEAAATTTTTKVVEVTDKDDDVKVAVEDEGDGTIELTDKSGNVLTIVPVYNCDGVTIIAGYIESAKDKNGKALTEKEYEYIKTVIALDVDKENNITLRYSADNKLVTMTALCDKNGYIIALQDSIDIDKDKDTEEYFKVSTKLDSQKNLFIKLEKDDKGKLINVTVEKSADKKTTTVVDETGKKTTATDSKSSVNLTVIVEDANKNNNSNSGGNNTNSVQNQNQSGNNNGNNNGGNNGGNSGDNTPSEPEKELDYIPIILKDNGKVACSASNVTVNEASALNGGTEVIINGAGEFSKYYVTSETNIFTGQLEFRFSVDENVEVKVYNVSISTQKKTAIKFTNVDSEKEKEADSEESGVGGNTGSSAVTAAPSVEFSITGTNSFKANGSGKNGTIYSECRLAIKGHGSADIDGGQNLSGICSTESMTIKNATLNITSNTKQGISCDKKVTIGAGVTLNTNTKGDGIHCNKFEFNGAKTENAPESKITIKSLYDTNCADGIDSDEQILITGGTLNVVALTDGKYALKVRKVLKNNPNGIFKINGGTVTASGAQNTPLQNGAQKAVLATSASACTFTVGSVKSASAKSFICSPANVDDVTSSITGKKDVIWSSNVGTVSF
ncbi:MAG: carbohydrate-binding domain-containing protein [Eubacterium sp.]|nr:carbohydrate-binding domain-containing protein [Eubacterium sp.]